MTFYFVLAFLLSAAAYGVAAALLVIRLERHQLRTWRVKCSAADSALDAVNFANAVVASALSSWALYRLDPEERFKVQGGRSQGMIPDCTLGSVCGYISVETVLLLVTSYRVRQYRTALEMIKESLLEMVVFHLVALVGLASVVVCNAGYPLALWMVWSELTSVFIGLDILMSSCRCSRFIRRLSTILLKVCTSLLFLGQRVVLFYYLLWLCWKSIVWEVGFLFQMALLTIGTLLNTHIAWGYISNEFQL